MATSIASLKRLSRLWLPGISVLLRGNHGIGKSAVVYQIAEDLGLPVMERRLSQMSEGDMIGLPWQETLGEAVTDTALDDKMITTLAGIVGVPRTRVTDSFKVTSFAPPDWLAKCAEAPHIIFLDELNRATPEVMQAAFQLVLDRRVGSLKVHPDCRIYAAINTAASYQVNEMDPALLDRFAVVDLEPTVEDWLDWGRGSRGINFMLLDFISQHQGHLEIGIKDKVTPGSITPSRRSWDRLDACLTKAELYTEEGINSPDFFALSASMVGTTTASAFQHFCKSNNFITAEDVLDRWKKTAPRVKKLTQDNRTPELTGLLDRLGAKISVTELTADQMNNYADFTMSLPNELAVKAWCSVAQSKSSEIGLANARKIPQKLSTYFVEIIQKARTAGNVKS